MGDRRHPFVQTPPRLVDAYVEEAMDAVRRLVYFATDDAFTEEAEEHAKRGLLRIFGTIPRHLWPTPDAPGEVDRA